MANSSPSFEAYLPADLSAEAKATYFGMFFTWAVITALEGDDVVDTNPVTSRSVTPGAYMLKVRQGKRNPEDLNEDGNGFAEFCFGGTYQAAYKTTVGDLHHPEDTWENFAHLARALDLHYLEWYAGRE